VLFHMLTGRTPFMCEGVGEYIVAHLQQQPPAASSVVPGLHPLIDVLLIRCLAKNPEERFQTMAELQEAIGDVMSRISVPGVTSLPAAASPVLGEGFRSGNGAEVPSRSSVTPDGWFQETPADAALRSYAGSQPDIRLGMSRGKKLALTAMMIGALVTALFATRVAIGDDEADMPMAPDVASRESLAPTAVASRDIAPPPPTEATVEHSDYVDLTEPEKPAAIESPSAATLHAVVKATQPARMPTRAQSRPARRAVPAVTREPTEDEQPTRVPSKLPPPPTPTEDLYDTR
jgi:serine/threonine protein kinase